MAPFARDHELRADLETRFVYHAPTPEQVPIYEAIRARAKEFAEFLVDTCPRSRELSRALDHLDDVVFKANASIARRS